MSHHLWGKMDGRDLAESRAEAATSDFGRDVDDAAARHTSGDGRSRWRYCRPCGVMRPKAGPRANDAKFVCPLHDREEADGS